MIVNRNNLVIAENVLCVPEEMFIDYKELVANKTRIKVLKNIERVKNKLDSYGVATYFVRFNEQLLNKRLFNFIIDESGDNYTGGGSLKFINNQKMIELDLDIACNYGTRFIWEAGGNASYFGYEDFTPIYDDENTMVKTIFENLKKNHLI